MVRIGIRRLVKLRPYDIFILNLSGDGPVNGWLEQVGFFWRVSLVELIMAHL